jgi:Flp pilus assembly pilin Flp
MRFSNWFNFLRPRGRREEGQTMAEYAVVLGTIAVGCVLAFTALSGGISNGINAVAGIFG